MVKALENLKAKIFGNPKNRALMIFFRLETSAALRSWSKIKLAFEGEYEFFGEYAKSLPAATKYRLGIYSILVNEETGQIFALHFGRFTFIFRCDFKRNGFENSVGFRIAETLDDFIDIRSLGENWAILNKFSDARKQLEWSFQLTKDD